MDAIVAVYSDWGIGARGTQPVVLPEDRKHFAALTAGAAVIVGRRTMEDFPGGRPLRGRTNLVLTRRAEPIDGAVTVRTPEEAAALAGRYERVFVIGGESVFRQMLPHIDRVFVTKIALRPHSDSFFPDLDALPDWRCADAGEPLESGGIGYRFCTYERRDR